MTALCVVLDTDVLLSGLAYPGSIPGKIVAAWRHGSIHVVLSDYILDELRRVLPRLAHRHQLSTAEIDDFVDILSIQAEIIPVGSHTDTHLRDSNDQPVLATYVAAREQCAAQYLITGDKDLLALADRHTIVTPAGFWISHGV
jgi:putative PIN family toxin of toxin-antitoxin system